jgi:hypothetical protein
VDYLNVLQTKFRNAKQGGVKSLQKDYIAMKYLRIAFCQGVGFS